MIHPTQSSLGLNPGVINQPAPPPAARPRAAAAGDTLSTAQSSSLQEALRRQPEIRPEAVARAKALAADPSYPSAAVIRQISAAIVAAPDPSESQPGETAAAD
jgi:hypothetical protein